MVRPQRLVEEPTEEHVELSLPEAAPPKARRKSKKKKHSKSTYTRTEADEHEADDDDAGGDCLSSAGGGGGGAHEPLPPAERTNEPADDEGDVEPSHCGMGGTGRGGAGPASRSVAIDMD